MFLIRINPLNGIAKLERSNILLQNQGEDARTALCQDEIGMLQKLRRDLLLVLKQTKKSRQANKPLNNWRTPFQQPSPTPASEKLRRL